MTKYQIWTVIIEQNIFDVSFYCTKLILNIVISKAQKKKYGIIIKFFVIVKMLALKTR